MGSMAVRVASRLARASAVLGAIAIILLSGCAFLRPGVQGRAVAQLSRPTSALPRWTAVAVGLQPLWSGTTAAFAKQNPDGSYDDGIPDDALSSTLGASAGFVILAAFLVQIL